MATSLGCTSCKALATRFVLFEDNEDIDARCRQCAKELERSNREVTIAAIDNEAVREAAYESLH